METPSSWIHGIGIQRQKIVGRDLATLVFTDDQGRIELIRLSQLESINIAKEPAA